MNVLIVEDEQLAADRLSKLLLDIDPSIQILCHIDTVKEAAVFMESHADNLDLVFLDIQLADGKSFEIFTKINYSKPVIFTTAYDEYAIQAFKINSIDYLLKPVKEEELQTALIKFNELRKDSRSDLQLNKELVAQLISGKKEYKKRFLVKFGSRIQYVNTTDSALFFAEDKICHLHEKQSGKRFLIDHTLEELSTGLLDPSQFFRISRQAILNVDAVKELNTKNNQLEVLLNIHCDHKLVVSRGRAKEFKEWLSL